MLVWVRLLFEQAWSHVPHSENVLLPSKSWESGRGTHVYLSSFHRLYYLYDYEHLGAGAGLGGCQMMVLWEVPTMHHKSFHLFQSVVTICGQSLCWCWHSPSSSSGITHSASHPVGRCLLSASCVPRTVLGPHATVVGIQTWPLPAGGLWVWKWTFTCQPRTAPELWEGASWPREETEVWVRTEREPKLNLSFFTGRRLTMHPQHISPRGTSGSQDRGQTFVQFLGVSVFSGCCIKNTHQLGDLKTISYSSGSLDV